MHQDAERGRGAAEKFLKEWQACNKKLLTNTFYFDPADEQYTASDYLSSSQPPVAMDSEFVRHSGHGKDPDNVSEGLVRRSFPTRSSSPPDVTSKSSHSP